MNWRDYMPRAWTLDDPGFKRFYLGQSPLGAAREPVNETTAVGISAVYRSVSLISGVIAGLPVKVYERLDDDSRRRVYAEHLERPGARVGMTRFDWTEQLVAWLLLHGNAYYERIRSNDGRMLGYAPIHPSRVSIELPDAHDPSVREYLVSAADSNGQPVRLRGDEVLHVAGMRSQGLYGLSVLSAGREAMSTAIAGDRTAGRSFSSGLFLGGALQVPEELTQDEAEDLATGIESRFASGGADRGPMIVNGAVEFKPWTMSHIDAQFLESRRFQVEEIARLFGVPKVLLAEDGASTWGSGIQELISGFVKFTLAPLVSRIDEQLSEETAPGRYLERDFAGLLRPSHREVVETLEIELKAGLISHEEARALLNREPLPESDRQTPAPPPPTAPAPPDPNEEIDPDA